MATKNKISFKILIASSILLTLFLLIGQTFSLINYETAVTFGLQESVEEVGDVGIAFAKGFALADTIIYIPLLIAGIIGLLRQKKYGVFTLLAACAISVYWPIVHLYAIFIERNTIVLHSEKYVSFPIILSLIILYGLWGMWYLFNNQNNLIKERQKP